MNVGEAIRTKRAIRRFAATPLPEAVLERILRAGRRAQSSKNTQPWQFILVRDAERLRALARLGPYADHLAGAPAAVILITPDPKQRWSILFDAGQAAAYMQLAAWEMGIGSCPASIYELEKARQILGFPAEWHLRIALSFGYPLKEEKLTEPPKKGGRAALDEIVHWEKW